MPGLLRYQLFLAYTVALMAFWATIHQQNYPAILVQPFPFWILLGLALYAAASIIYGVATLGDFPEASSELEGEIKEAKEAMKKRGIPISGEDK